MLGEKLRRCNLSTTNPKWTSQTLNLGLCDDRLVTMARSVVIKMGTCTGAQSDMVVYIFTKTVRLLGQDQANASFLDFD